MYAPAWSPFCDRCFERSGVDAAAFLSFSAGRPSEGLPPAQDAAAASAALAAYCRSLQAKPGLVAFPSSVCQQTDTPSSNLMCMPAGCAGWRRRCDGSRNLPQPAARPAAASSRRHAWVGVAGRCGAGRPPGRCPARGLGARRAAAVCDAGRCTPHPPLSFQGIVRSDDGTAPASLQRVLLQCVHSRAHGQTRQPTSPRAFHHPVILSAALPPATLLACSHTLEAQAGTIPQWLGLA
jgi:hypothetical protein